MMKHLLVALVTLATASTLDPPGLGHVQKKYDDKEFGIIAENDTNIDSAVKQRTRRNLNGQQDPSNDYPVVVVIGDSGVGKSTFLNYVANFDASHPYYFEKGEQSLGAVTKYAVAKQLAFRGNQNLNFIGVDTPGLGDKEGGQQDRKFMKNITKYLVENFGEKGKKIDMFLYIYKGGETRTNFNSLKVYNAMFGPTFFNHLVFEVTFWKHDPFSKMNRKRDRGIDETILRKKIRDLLMKTTRIEKNVAEKVPIVFVDPVYNPLDYQGFGPLGDQIAQTQATQEENLRNEIFESPREGIICAAKCQVATDRIIQMLENDFNPIIREGNELTTYHATSLQLTCIVPIMEQDCECFEASWSQNGSMIEPGEFHVAIEEDGDGFFKRIDLFHGYNTGEEAGLYQCEAKTCKLGSNICETKTSGEVTVTVNKLPPQIIFTSVNEIECIQEYPGESVQVSFRIYRKDLDSHIENLVTRHFLESGIEFIGNGIKKKFFNRKAKDTLQGEYFCQTQFGESKRIRVENPDVNGGWSSWTAFTPCSVTCGGGTRSRSRDCTAPPKLNNGMDCEGPNKQKIRCNAHACEANIDLIHSVDGSQDIPLDVELQPRTWCCNTNTQICESENMYCEPTDLIHQYCFGVKCKSIAESMKITTALTEIDVDIENDCKNFNIVGIHFDLKDLEREVNKPTCPKITRKIINIKADTVTASESITLTGVETINIMARIILFNSDSNMEILFNQHPTENYRVKQMAKKSNGRDGADGENGKPGHDGALVYVIADHVVARQPINIVVVGGQGGDGQDGADGLKGIDGTDGSNMKYNNENWHDYLANYNAPTGSHMGGGITTGNCLAYTKHVYNEGASCYGFSPNKGGNGRQGGNGGLGGNGGGGGSSGFVSFISKKVHGEIKTKILRGIGGSAGRGGAGKPGGRGGSGGLGATDGMDRGGAGGCYRSDGTSAFLLMWGTWSLSVGAVQHCYHLELKAADGSAGSAGYHGRTGRKGRSGSITDVKDLVDVGSSIVATILEKRSLQYLMMNEDISEEDLNVLMFFKERDIEYNMERKHIVSYVGYKGSELPLRENLKLLEKISIEASSISPNSRLNEITSKIMDTIKMAKSTTLTYMKTRLEKDISEMNYFILLSIKKQNALLESLPRTVMSALDSRIPSIIDKEKADRLTSILKTGFSVLSLGTGVEKIGSSLANSGRDLEELIPSETESVASVITKSSTLVTKGISIGCKDTMLTNVIKSLTNHNNSAIQLEQMRSSGQEIGNDDFTRPFVQDFRKYKNEEVSQSIVRYIWCTVVQYIDYQKEQSVEANYLRNIIGEYVTTDKQRLKLLEKMYEKKQELDLVQAKLDNPLKYILEINGILDVREGLKMFYTDIEYETLQWLQDYVAALEYQYREHFEVGTEIRNILKIKMSVPFSTNYNAISNLNSLITQKVNIAKSVLKTPIVDEFYIIIKDENILRDLETSFQTKINLETLPENSTVVSKKQIHTNARIRKIYVNLEFTTYPETNPREIYVEVSQDSIINFYLDDITGMSKNSPHRNSESAIKTFNKFEPKSPKSIEDQIKSHFEDLGKELCSSDDDDMCPGLHSSYYINIPRSGGDNKLLCPNYAPLVNCHGLQLSQPSALHIAVQYSVRV